MLFSVLLFIAGLFLLAQGANWFVDGASGIARRFHLSELLIGATVVSIGTTLPEVLVSSTSALSGHSDMAFGNAIGSVICNTALIAAISITAHPLKAKRRTLFLPCLFFLISAIFTAGIAYFFGEFSRISGLLLLILFIIYLVSSISEAKRGGSEDSEPAVSKQLTPVKSVLMLILGAVMITIGARLLVDGGSELAELIGVPESVIALTVVALGTSLPELMTAIMSVIKGHMGLSIGNVIGANVFNLVLVCGTSAFLHPFAVPASSLFLGRNATLVLDIPVMFIASLVLIVPALIKGKFFRSQGIVLLILYISYCIILFCL